VTLHIKAQKVRSVKGQFYTHKPCQFLHDLSDRRFDGSVRPGS